MTFPRRSGLLLHPTSLPCRFGIGDWGSNAYQFVDFLNGAMQTYWQMLPLSPTGYGDSPYQAVSAFAGNPMLISPEKLAEQGWLSADIYHSIPNFPTYHVDFGWIIHHKTDLLKRAFANFQKHNDDKSAFAAFCKQEAHWLDDYALFASLKEQFELRPWYEWGDAIKRREPSAMSEWREKLAEDIERHQFWQWLFFTQLGELKQYASEKGVQLIGDIPIFIALDSADVWANTDLFMLDDQLDPIVVSGVPPDYFSETGQLWGHPHYRWDVMEKNGYKWWIDRFRMLQQQADVIRIDHFRGFYNYWEVPASAETAINGKWKLGAGIPFFDVIKAALGDVPIIAEDLGDFDKESRAGLDAIQAKFNYPGMKILVFAFDTPKNIFLPHNYTPENVVYTGTHDNDTAVGWYYDSETTDATRDFFHRYLRVGKENVAWDLIRLAWSSVANTAIAPVQDVLGYGNDAKMNTPGTVGPPNWMWRMAPDALHEGHRQGLAELTGLYNRLPT